MKKIIPSCGLLLLCYSTGMAQFSETPLEYMVPLERTLLQRYEEALNAKDVSFHTAFRPWTTAEMRTVVPYDSLNSFPIGDNHFNKTWFGGKLRNEHLFTVKVPDFRLA